MCYIHNLYLQPSKQSLLLLVLLVFKPSCLQSFGGLCLGAGCSLLGILWSASIVLGSLLPPLRQQSYHMRLRLHKRIILRADDVRWKPFWEECFMLFKCHVNQSLVRAVGRNKECTYLLTSLVVLLEMSPLFVTFHGSVHWSSVCHIRA